ncbi:hypothetical protein CP965_05425 [Halarcobacter mediterraneus]|uniref:Uncharacterized protein n=1 Tax=Halarcobacter mediterraneus TaxID=2023153 RepID=A0A4Q1AW17_9BACT|nr:hypothetical protein [Halarcobacter mediterraneus]RXK13241.1 hypothetical protein CP965_05425 [Halarcobacter mediterraneus]
MAEEHIIKFSEYHDLGFDIYEASDASLRYSNLFMGNRTKEFDDEPRNLAPSKTSEDEEDMRANMGIFPVFAGKVRLTWHDYNDNPIEYSFDFNDIFPDKTIPYPKELEDLIIWEEPLEDDPGIILEIINRTLNIYTIVDIDTLIPGTNKIKTIRYHEKVYTKEF